MMSAAVSRRARELAAQGTPYVTATVVRAQHPTSAQAGDAAIVLGDGAIEGFVGGVCAEHSVRVQSLQALATGEAVLLRILPDTEEGTLPTAAGTGDDEASNQDGAITVKNTCLSGGAIEVFLEPVLPAPRVLVQGETPIAGAVRRICPELGLEPIAVDRGAPEPSPGDLALVLAAHGRDDLHVLRRALEAAVPYVGLVASHRRGAGVIAELREDGVPGELLELIDMPAGIEIGAQTAAEIALSILAKVVAVRRGLAAGDEGVRAGTAPAAPGTSAPAGAPPAPSPPATRAPPVPAAPVIAVDPICGMTVAAVPGTPSVQHDGETIYFCREGCKAEFQSSHEHALAAD